MRRVLINHKALKISQAVGIKIEMAVSYNNLGAICHNGLGKLDEALVYHQKALEIRKESGYRIAEGMSYHNFFFLTFESENTLFSKQHTLHYS